LKIKRRKLASEADPLRAQVEAECTKIEQETAKSGRGYSGIRSESIPKIAEN